MTRASTPETFVLDAGALIALERTHPLMTEMLFTLRAGRARAVLPDGVLAQVWRGGGRQARLGWLLGLKPPQCRRVPLDTGAAKRIGAQIARTGHADVVDTHVALVALDNNAVVITSDRADILRAAPALRDRIVDI